MSAVSLVVQTEAQATQSAAGEHYRADVDGLRGIAVLAVIGFHAFPALFPGGFVGVDVFFVISGFLITSIILRQLRDSAFSLSKFYARRVRRIFPALVVMLATCLAFGWFALLPNEFEELGKHVASASVFVSNFTLWRESGYFSQAAEFKPLLHLWSLGIEEQFYLLWPLLLLIIWKRQRNVVLTTLLLSLASFATSVAIGHANPSAGFYLPFTRFWELGLGCLLATVNSRGELTQRRCARSAGPLWRPLVSFAHSVSPIVGLGLIATAIFLFDDKTPFPGFAALVPTVGTTFVILGRADSWFQRRVVASTGLVLIGLISYPLYLWHWPVLSFATILEAGTPSDEARVVAVLLSLLLAWLTFRFIERPVRARRSTRMSLGLAGALSIFGVAGLGVFGDGGFADRYAVNVGAIQPQPRTDAGCRATLPEPVGVNYCKRTSTTPPLAMFVGDSRAQGVYDGIVNLFGTSQPLVGARQPLLLLGRGGCVPMLSVHEVDPDQHGCEEIWSALVRQVEQTKPAVVVVVGGGSELLAPSAYPLAADNGRKFKNRNAAFEHGVRELIRALQKSSRVIYLRQIPPFESAPACFLRRMHMPGSQCSPTMERRVMEQHMAAYNHIIDTIEAEVPELRVVDSMPAVCDATTCSQKRPSGEILYSDALHLSPAGGRRLARTTGLPVAMMDQAIAAVSNVNRATVSVP